MTIWDWVSSILWKIDLEEFKLNFTIIKKKTMEQKKKKKILPILVQSINISPIELSLENSPIWSLRDLGPLSILLLGFW